MSFIIATILVIIWSGLLLIFVSVAADMIGVQRTKKSTVLKVVLTIIIILIITLANTATAAVTEDDDGVWAVKTLEDCKAISVLAELAMKERHKGNSSMHEMMAFYESKAWHKMLEMAYEEPRYMSDMMVKKSVADFRDMWYLECYKLIKN